MSKVFNLKSKFLNSLNKTLQDLTMKESITILKSPIMEADGNFTSVVQTVNNDLDKSKLDTNITVDDEENKKTEEIIEKKKQLKDLVIDKIKQTLDVSDELQAVLNDLDKLNKEDHSKEWVVNKEDNTATLNDKNMRIFKQNEKLCLSHNGKIEIFDSVEELHDWLNKNNIKLPEGIAIHESSDYPNRPNLNFNAIGAWKNILKTPLNSEKRIGDTQSKEDFEKELEDLKRSDEGEMLSKKKMNKAETNKYLDRHPEEDPTKEIKVMDNIIFPEEECTTTASLGAPMQYTANKKLNEEELVEYGRDSAARAARASKFLSMNDSERYTKLGIQNLIRNIDRNKATKLQNTDEFLKTLPIYTNNEEVHDAIDNFAVGKLSAGKLGDIIDSQTNYNFLNDGKFIVDKINNTTNDSDRETLKRIFNIDFDATDDEKNTIGYHINNDFGPVFNQELAFITTGTRPKPGAQLGMAIASQSPKKLYDGILEIANAAKETGFDIKGLDLIPNPDAYKSGEEFNKAFKKATDLRDLRFKLNAYMYVITNRRDANSTKESRLNKVQELFPEIFDGNLALQNTEVSTPDPIVNTPSLSKEQKIANSIKQSIETEREKITSALDADLNAKKEVIQRYAVISELSKEDASLGNDTANELLSSKKSNLIKKGVLLRLMDNNVPLSADTLLNFANSLKVDVGNDYKLLNKSEISNILKQYNQSNLISNIKNALDFGAPQEQIINKVQNQEKDVQKAVASAVLQDPEVDTTNTKQAWEALLESIKNKSFKEKMHVLKEALFKEDETPEDFSSGISSEMNTSDTDTTSTSTDDTAFNTDSNNSTPNNQPPSFGDINIDAGGFDPDEYGPDVADDDNLEGLPVPTEEFVIEDVLVNKEDKTDIKVKLKNVQTGEIVMKNLSEIDI